MTDEIAPVALARDDAEAAAELAAVLAAELAAGPRAPFLPSHPIAAPALSGAPIASLPAPEPPEAE